MSRNKILSKFVAIVQKYKRLFKDILTFLGLDYRDASLTILYLIVIGISAPKFICKNVFKKVKIHLL